MKQNEKFNIILSDCLDRILKGETVEQCLNNYPEQAKELEPLLRTALVAKAASTIQPPAEFKARARYEFQSALRDIADKNTRHRPAFSLRWQWHSGWAIAVVAIIVVILGGGTTIAAASNSMPDSTLYPVKLTTENVQLALTSSNLDKTELNAKFANRRADEIVYLASKGEVDQVQIASERLNTNLENMTQLAGNEIGNKSVQSTGSNPLAIGPTPVSPEVTAQSSSPVESPEVSPPMDASIPTVTPAATDVDTQSQANDGSTKSGQEATNSIGKVPEEPGSTPFGVKTLSPKLEKLRKIIKDNFEKRQNRLEEALKTAPPNLKPALNKALFQSKTEYYKAIHNLEDAQQEGN
jgi:hypothetical protein